MAVVHDVLALEPEWELPLELAQGLQCQRADDGQLLDVCARGEGVVAGAQDEIVYVGLADVFVIEIAGEGGIALRSFICVSCASSIAYFISYRYKHKLQKGWLEDG